jgi:hypothetical protein
MIDENAFYPLSLPELEADLARQFTDLDGIFRSLLHSLDLTHNNLTLDTPRMRACLQAQNLSRLALHELQRARREIRICRKQDKNDNQVF